ncbi:NusG domain II-containing protein [Anaeromicropila populeti]|uniref:Uncharacterized protein n=1 Tax=Anaeromicropila populeti TaxID=37658 RepID=A0A1I6I9U3_9FIRM|nr:NusG domain II-containing protein [Anaeromicropila populeti]SFR63451.1 hypothetical protein SAMN05661086_00586 [Anaeromicropila populeti]
MKKNDFILVLVMVVLAGAFFIGREFVFSENNLVVQVKVEGQVYKTVSLREDIFLEIVNSKGKKNVLEIKDGKASITHADCPNQYCVHHKEISKAGESIICLPNQVVVSIKGDEEAELDAVS